MSELDVSCVIEVLEGQVGDRIYFWGAARGNETVEEIAQAFVEAYDEATGERDV